MDSCAATPVCTDERAHRSTKGKCPQTILSPAPRRNLALRLFTIGSLVSHFWNPLRTSLIRIPCFSCAIVGSRCSTIVRIENDVSLSSSVCMCEGRKWGREISIPSSTRSRCVRGRDCVARPTDPSALFSYVDPVSHYSFEAIVQALKTSEEVICGWRKHGRLLSMRENIVLRVAEFYPGQTNAPEPINDGIPAHPLDLHHSAQPFPMP